VLSAAKLRWGSPDFHKNGRKGQKQNGVDIWGDNEDGLPIGVQCKNTLSGLELSTVRSEVANAEHFVPPIKKLYVVTAGKRDAGLQKAIRELSQKRRGEDKFAVNVLFWEDICFDLAKDDEVFFKHYPQFRNLSDEKIAHDRKLYDRFCSLLSSHGVIGFIDRNNMAGFSFPLKKLDPLHEFHFAWNNPENEFILPELDTLRMALWEKIHEYLNLIAFQTFPTDSPGWNTVPPEWETEQPERFDRVVGALHSLAAEIVELHAKLVRIGRASLVGKYIP